jgi:hypothetical protein
MFFLTTSACLFAGIEMLFDHRRADAFSGLPLWMATLFRYTPYLMLALPFLAAASYFLSYFETLPDSLECRHVWRRLSIPYSEIDRISPSKNWFGVTIRLRYSRVRTLPIFVDKPTEFLADISGRATQAKIV